MNKTCVITGSTSGIGLETTRAIARKGYDVIMVARNEEKGIPVRDEIIKSTGNNNVELLLADLSSQKQIRKLGKQIRERFDVLDVLVNNAGTWFSKLTYSEDQIEMQFAVNHLAYFLITHILLPNLLKSENGRIVNVASDSHINGHIDFDDLYLTKNYFGLNAYRQSKLANVMFTYELARKIENTNVVVNALQPGLVKTKMGHKHTIGLHSLAWWFRKQGGVKPEKGAETSVYLATAEEAGKISGKYWDKCKTKPSGDTSYDEEASKKLWGICEKLTDITQFMPI
jgi:retinol dehydrogenase 12